MSDRLHGVGLSVRRSASPGWVTCFKQRLWKVALNLLLNRKVPTHPSVTKPALGYIRYSERRAQLRVDEFCLKIALEDRFHQLELCEIKISQ